MSLLPFAFPSSHTVCAAKRGTEQTLLTDHIFTYHFPHLHPCSLLPPPVVFHLPHHHLCLMGPNVLIHSRLNKYTQISFIDWCTLLWLYTRQQANNNSFSGFILLLYFYNISISFQSVSHVPAPTHLSPSSSLTSFTASALWKCVSVLHLWRWTSIVINGIKTVYLKTHPTAKGLLTASLEIHNHVGNQQTRYDCHLQGSDNWAETPLVCVCVGLHLFWEWNKNFWILFTFQVKPPTNSVRK